MLPFASPTPHIAAAALRRARKLLFVRLHRHASLRDGAFCEGFEATVAAIEAELAHEAIVMDTLAFDGLHERLAANALLRASLHRIVMQVEAGDVALGRAALGAACDLLSLHRLTADLALLLARPVVPVRAAQGQRWGGRRRKL